MTLIINGKVVFLSSHLRAGADNNFYDHNGIVIGINDNGYTKDKAYKYKIGNRVNKSPRDHQIKKIKIPGYKDAVEIAKNEHKKFGHFRLVSWDFAIDKYGDPILIEFNLRFQGLNHHQLTSGTVFGKYTDDVLSEVYS